MLVTSMRNSFLNFELEEAEDGFQLQGWPRGHRSRSADAKKAPTTAGALSPSQEALLDGLNACLRSQQQRPEPQKEEPEQATESRREKMGMGLKKVASNCSVSTMAPDDLDCLEEIVGVGADADGDAMQEEEMQDDLDCLKEILCVGADADANGDVPQEKIEDDQVTTVIASVKNTFLIFEEVIGHGEEVSGATPAARQRAKSAEPSTAASSSCSESASQKQEVEVEACCGGSRRRGSEAETEVCCAEKLAITRACQLGSRPRPSDSFQHCRVPKNQNLAEEFSRRSAETPPTTLMIRNIPNRYSQQELVQELECLGFLGTFDFLYAPMDTGSMGNVGYMFVNFVNADAAEGCRGALEGYAFARHQRSRGKKAATVSVAHLQGLEANLRHYKKSAVKQWTRLKHCGPVVLLGGVNGTNAASTEASNQHMKGGP